MESVCILCRKVYLEESSTASIYTMDFCSAACEEKDLRRELLEEERAAAALEG